MVFRSIRNTVSSKFPPLGPTLKHQRPQEERQIKYSGITDWYKKGVNKEKVATREVFNSPVSHLNTGCPK